MEVTSFQFQSQAKAKSRAADPSGAKRTSSETVAGSLVKANIADPTWEKRKVDSDAEDEGLQGSPMRTKVQDEEMLNRLHSIPRDSALHVLHLHTGSKLTGDSEKHGIHTLDLGDLNMDTLDNRGKLQRGCEK